MTIALLLPQFNFIYLFFLIFQFRQFNCHNSIFYFYFWQYHCRYPFSLSHIRHIISLSFLLLFLRISAMVLLKFSSLLISQISLNSTHIINKLHFLQYSARRLSIWQPIFEIFLSISISRK